MNTNEFLRAFFPDENEPIYFQVFKPKDAPDTDSNRPQNYSASRKKLAQPGGEIELRKFNHLRGVYFAPNAGGNSDADINRFNAVFVESDDLPIEEQHRILDDCPLAVSIRVETKKSVHAYWLLKENCTADEWRDAQKRLIAYFDGDKSIKNPSRVMRLPFYMHLTYNEQATGRYDCKPVELVQLYPERRYSIAELTEAFQAAEKSADDSSAGVVVSEIIGNGNRNNELFSLAGGLRRKGLGENEILAMLREVNRTRVKPPLPETEIASIAKSVLRYSPEDSVFDTTAKKDDAEEVESLSVPVLSNAALYGPGGRDCPRD